MSLFLVDLLACRRAEELHWQEEEVECMETNLCGEEHYDAAGCPVVPLVFSGILTTVTVRMLGEKCQN